MTFGSLFSGIGGMDLGFARAGFEVAFQVEIDPWCRRVLAKHWPDVRRHDDVRTFPPTDPGEWRVDVVCGGFPCQDISRAGGKEALRGSRSGLWFEFVRVVRLLRPRFVVVENSADLVVRGLPRVLGDLAALGFDAEWSVVSACSLGAPHVRERLFLVAYADGLGQEAGGSEGGGDDDPLLGGRVDTGHVQAAPVAGGCQGGADWGLEPALARMADGVPDRVERLGGLGNAVAPQVAEWIGRRVLAVAGG